MDDSKVTSAINVAISEASSYLSAFDVTAVFNSTGDNRNAIVLQFVKDIAIWHYIQLSNANIEMELRMERYKLAIKFFEKVQSGKTVPNLPYVTVDAPAQAENFIKWGSNPKRNNYFN
jgi:phage gp36-like protein